MKYLFPALLIFFLNLQMKPSRGGGNFEYCNEKKKIINYGRTRSNKTYKESI